jgi:hypothetical protein
LPLGLNHGVRSREKQGLVAVLLPSDEIRWSAVCTTDFEHLAIAIRLTDVMAFDDKLA